MAGWLTCGWLVGWLWLAGWTIGWLAVGWLIGGGWLDGLLVGWFAGWLDCCWRDNLQGRARGNLDVANIVFVACWVQICLIELQVARVPGLTHTRKSSRRQVGKQAGE